MENDVNNKHRIEYSKRKAYTHGILAAVSILLIFILQPLWPLWASLVLIFVLYMLVQIIKLNKIGSFEEIIVTDSSITYTTGKSGTKVLEPQNIQDIKIKEWQQKGSTKYAVKIFIDGQQKPLYVNLDFPKYKELVKEIKNFWQK